MASFQTVIVGTGAYIPSEIKNNRDFTVHDFYGENHHRIDVDPEKIVEKFREITGIQERRYATKELNASDIAAMAAKSALDDCGLDPETIDQIIVAHNFGNVIKHTIQTDAVPSL
ncbi:MAG: ketoacyl-ACP synthase III, partial [Chitinophagaceae bacterium]